DQGGLNLPEKSYYTDTAKEKVKIRNAYVKYIAKMFSLVGVDTATASKKAAGIMKLETAIAAVNLAPVELRDPVKNYNKFAFTDFQKQMPDVDLKDAFDRMGLHADTVLVGQPKYYQALDGLLKSTPIDAWKDKATFEEISGSSPMLSKRFRDANFDFFNKMLGGEKKPKERWKTISAAVDGGL